MEEAQKIAQDESLRSGLENSNALAAKRRSGITAASTAQTCCGAVDIARVLYYMRSAFDSEILLDKVPLEAAGNPGAWHAWQAHRAKMSAQAPSAVASGRNQGSPSSLTGQQPGGARRPGQWNWEGVWEERVKKGINASISQQALYSSGQDADLVGFVTLANVILANKTQINFLDADSALLEQIAVWKQNTEMAAEPVIA